MMGYGDEGTLALFARLRYARRTPPFKTGIRRKLQAGSVGAVPPHQRGRDRPGLSANSHPAEALWPIPG